jgi:hypothetical protein
MIIWSLDSNRVRYCKATATLRLAVQSIGAVCVEWPVQIELNSKRHHERQKIDFPVAGEDEFQDRVQYKSKQRTGTRSKILNRLKKKNRYIK